MSIAAQIRSWVKAVSGRSKLERDRDEELRFHMEEQAADLERQGLSREAARERARADFGVVAARKDEMRDALGLRVLDDARADLRYAVRMLRQSPAFTAVAVVSGPNRVFGGLALILAGVGIYGVIAYSVTRRTNEIGLRVALGAQREQVLGMILRESVWLAAVGIAMGLAAVVALTGYVRRMLYGLTPTDPGALAGAVLLLAAMALGAAWQPARRASRLDPLVALRHE